MARGAVGDRMDNSTRSQRTRFLPDWILGGVVRLSLVPGLWIWGRAYAGDWPEAVPELVAAARIWDVPFLPASAVATLAVWGAQLAALMLFAGVLTRLIGLLLLLASLVYMAFVAPDAWGGALLVSALSFYLFARGGGALSIDGAIVATTR